nr:MAG TPA: hypothetical protein [Caudoviricetes sp.]
MPIYFAQYIYYISFNISFFSLPSVSRITCSGSIIISYF